MGFYDNNFTPRIFSVNDTKNQIRDREMVENLLQGNSRVVAIIQCSGVTFNGGKYGFSWRLEELMVFPQARLVGCNIQLDEDEKQDEPRAITEQVAVKEPDNNFVEDDLDNEEEEEQEEDDDVQLDEDDELDQEPEEEPEPEEEQEEEEEEVRSPTPPPAAPKKKASTKTKTVRRKKKAEA